MNESIAYQADQPVSLVIICRNKVDVLPKVLGNVAANTRRPDLVVLSDDNSDDGTPERFEALCRRHGLACQVIAHEGTGIPFRLNTLRNDGIRACPDGLVTVIDADMVPCRTYFETHRRVHLEYPGELVVSTGPRLEYAFPDGSGPVNFLWGFEMVGQLSAPPVANYPSFPIWQVTLVSMMGMTRQAIAEAGWFDTQYDGNYGYDDLDFMIRVDRMGAKFHGDWEAHVIHIPHPPTLGKRDNEPNRKKFIAKYGFDNVYPDILSYLCRKPWNEHFRDLMENRGDQFATQPLPLEAASERLLLRVFLRSCLRRLKLLR